ncbi:hypothetical protein Ocin01_00184 [Orchesella cincta]|uniref:Uncharacterized protein n=1 Tax=Orchesella cincta TaxID=48709 RepID=A0A1D2NMQ0_ORCCI|nr:hypothetical protein Ocin01_00184 [Orchesella cincta]
MSLHSVYMVQALTHSGPAYIRETHFHQSIIHSTSTALEASQPNNSLFEKVVFKSICKMQGLVIFAMAVAAASAYNMGRSGGLQTVYDSQRDGLSHPYVVYDSVRDGANSGKQMQYANDPSLSTVFDSKRDGWNHPYVVSNTRSSGSNGMATQRRVAAPAPQQMQITRSMPMQQTRSQQQPRSQPTSYDNYEVIFDSQRDGWNHPWVVYDSKRDGLDSPLRSQFDNDPNLVTVFDSKVDGWNHPYVIYDSKRDGAQRRF